MKKKNDDIQIDEVSEKDEPKTEKIEIAKDVVGESDLKRSISLSGHAAIFAKIKDAIQAACDEDNQEKVKDMADQVGEMWTHGEAFVDLAFELLSDVMGWQLPKTRGLKHSKLDAIKARALDSLKK